MYYQLIIFIGECKNQEMPLCIKYLNVKELKCETAPHINVSLLLTFNLLKSTARSYFFGRRADLRAILMSIFLSWGHKNVHILKACTEIMWLG